MDHQSWVTEDAATSPPAPVCSSPLPVPGLLGSPKVSDAEEVDVGDLFPEIDGDSSADPDWQLDAASAASSPPSSPVSAAAPSSPVSPPLVFFNLPECSVSLPKFALAAVQAKQVLQPLCLVLITVTNLTCSG